MAKNEKRCGVVDGFEEREMAERESSPIKPLQVTFPDWRPTCLHRIDPTTRDLPC